MQIATALDLKNNELQNHNGANSLIHPDSKLSSVTSIKDIDKPKAANEANFNPDPLENREINTQLANSHSELGTATPAEETSSFRSLYKGKQAFLEGAAMKGSYVGMALHGLAAVSPFLNFLPKPLTQFSDKLATFYSRYLSGVPMVIFSIPQFLEKESVKALGQLSAAFSFPFIKTVENMPVGSSFFCGVKTAIEAIEEYKGPKAEKKSDSIFHQIEEFAINYSRMWKDSLSRIGAAESLKEKYKLLCNLVFLPGYSLVQGLGMKLCRDRISDSNQSKGMEALSRWTRTLRGILGIATDFFLLGSERADVRRVGTIFSASSILSLVPPWADKLFAKYPKETREKMINVIGQSCKALDELSNALWSKLPKMNATNEAA